jgi:hypothetical protein
MPTFENYTELQTTKMLFLGHTGAGKTGSLISLAAAGYNLRIIDFDNGVEILNGFLTDPTSPYLKAKPGSWTQDDVKDIIKRVHYLPVSETMLSNKNGVFPKGDAWGKFIGILGEWKDGDINLGKPQDWGTKDILVIDGLSRLSNAAFNHILAMNGRINARPEQSDFGSAQQLIERLLLNLYSSEFKCNVIMICHIAIQENEVGQNRGFAQSVGKALGPKIGQYFNHALMAKATGQGTGEKRMIYTNTSGLIELKSARPLKVKSEYPLDSGLADYFRDIRGGK